MYYAVVAANTVTNLSEVDQNELRVHPLTRADSPSIAQFIHEFAWERGAVPSQSREEIELIFDTPWLEDGGGLVLERGSEFGGYGWARRTQWRGYPYVDFGLYLRQPFRAPALYRVLTDPLLALAERVGAEHGISQAKTNYRSDDSFHAPIIQAIGFRRHAVSMLGYRHNLLDVPPHPPSPGVSLRVARLPEESQLLLSLGARSYDDPDKQGLSIHADRIPIETKKPGFQPDQVLVAEKDNEPVGYVFMAKTAFGGELAYELFDIGVVPGARRLGIGTAMVARALAWVKSRGSRIVLASEYSTNPAMSFFWRLGFRPNPRGTYYFYVRDLGRRTRVRPRMAPGSPRPADSN
jgi:GNAT superfamily N-acetyltransferase